MSNNETAFVHDEIQKFQELNAVRTITCAPYRNFTNVEAERYVAQLKKALVQDTTGKMQSRLRRFLYRQHILVHTGTGVISAKAKFVRELPSSWHRVVPPVADCAHSDLSMKGTPWET